MAASLRSPMDAHENTLRSVSDRRHYLGHPHHRARFPSLTEFPDSPSVYSHAYYSPDADVHSDTASFSRLSDPPGCLEFDDETASTIRSLSAEDVQDESDVDDCTDDASHRISLQGPKIRFHSRAPWETDDVFPHGEESDNNSRSGTIGSKLKGKASRADNLIRTFTRGSSIASRPSVDSARSQVSVTSSFEITAGNYSSSRGALYDLARESMSTSSLSSSAASASVHHQSFARATNYPKPSHYFTQTHAVSLDGIVPPPMTLESARMLPSSSDASRIGNERSAKRSPVPLPQERQSHDGFVHPYANPDLVVLYTPSLETIPSHHPILGDMSGSDSNSTVTDSASSRSAAFSVISTKTSTTSLTSRDPPHGNPRVNGKEISSPISVLRQSDINYVDRNTKFLSLHPPPTGFDGPRRSNPRSPTVALISLQEAQARERFRSNTVDTTVARPKLPFPNSDDIPETAEDQTEEMEAAGILARPRPRSTSFGTRHKTVPLPTAQPQIAEMREGSVVSTSTNAVPGRALKHKKSGFMRLFSGRNSEGEKERSPPPPIPPLVDVYAEQSLQIHGTGKTSKPTLTRMPKSTFSPTLHGSGASNATLASISSASSGGDGLDGKGPPRRRQPPSLSIVTKTSDHSISTSVVGQSSPTGLNFTTTPLSLTVPQSAPPGNTDFPGLKLRPVSTSFSSHFTDIVAGAVEELQHDVHTPSSAASSSTALSPFTPVSTRRSDDASATAVETLGEEYLTIKGLQDQLVSAKKAWHQQIRELRGQIRDLTSELEDLRAADNQVYCEVCGRGEPQRRHASPSDEQQPKKVGIVNRPRARTGDTARFASGN